VSVQADAREALTALTDALAGWSVDEPYRARTAQLAGVWEATVEAAYHPESSGADGRLSQNEVLGLVNEVSAPRDVVVCAAGSMPGDLHKMWRVRDPKGYHVEYGYSCMGYEVAGGIGVAMASPDRDVFVMVGDGSYLMMATELVTAVQEGVKVVVVLVQNHGFASIGALSEQLGSQRFGTRYRQRAANGRLEGPLLPVDLAANAASLGVDVLMAQDGPSLEAALRKAKASDRTTVVHVETDPLIDAPSSESWWDVPVSEVSTLESTRAARTVYDRWKTSQHAYLTPSESGRTAGPSTDHPATEENR
jgi:3D-(3,5/4)-trihydroxycyclohexane-1,2-dione acylhydrolase (decyclizing)